MSGDVPAFIDPGAASCPRCGGAEHGGVDAGAYCHLFGLYLGDGHIAAFPRTYCLRVCLDQAYPEIVAACVRSVTAVAPHNRVAVHAKSGCAIVQCYSKAWPCLFPQHGPGPKPRELIRGLIESDGSRHLNRIRRRGRPYAYPRYTFSNRSEDIKGVLCEHLDLLGIPWRRASDVNISIARREAVAALDSFVGPKR
jgi:hypothetical protein